MELSHQSSWRAVPRDVHFPPLATSLEVEVAIIGGGITGVTAAYLLRSLGTSVALLEGDKIGGWATGSTTGFLMETLDTPASELVSRLGTERATLVAESHREAIEQIERIVAQEGIECEFTRCPAYLYATSAHDADRLPKEADSLRQVGTSASFIQDHAAGVQNYGYVRIDHQAKFNSLKYLFSVAKACAAAGVQLYEQTEVVAIEEAGAVSTLTTKGGQQVRAKHVLMATHYPLDPQPAKLRFKNPWHTTYVLEASLAPGMLPEALYEDTETPYHYARVDRQGDFDRLIIGGEDHRSDLEVDEQQRFDALESYIKKILPGAPYTLNRAWKGRVVEPGDALAYLGTLGAGSVFYATGYSGTGLTYGTMAARLFAEFVQGTVSPVAAVYAADRSS